jgi:hypothetical protein
VTRDPSLPGQAAGGRRRGWLREEFIPVLALTVVTAAGITLIDWPPFVELTTGEWVGYVSMLVFPLGYLALMWTAGHIGRPEIVGLVFGLVYGGVMWVQMIVDLCFLNGLGPPECADYVSGHVYDLFTVAAVVAAVGYFFAGPRRITRMVSLALVLALTGFINGASETNFLWAHQRPLDYPYWVLPILWAITGAWYGLCVGYRPPNDRLVRALHDEPAMHSPRSGGGSEHLDTT